ncbi:hypothetical protein BURC_02891 [Burkholderiaceae bacterium]|nr:hypothetical protein BURC_02891 [Burkholderiaceae bacterium]
MKHLLAGLLWAAAVAQATPLRHELLDDFRDTSAWQASASDQVRASLRGDADGSLCLDHDFAGVSGYAVMRRALPMRWPENFALIVRWKGHGATNDVQVKFVDASGDNVWWMNRPNHRLPAQLREVAIKRRHIDFAWGPTTDRRLRETQFIEFVVAAGREGGRGSLCVARLSLDERAPDPTTWPDPVVKTQGRHVDIDWRHRREFNGLELRWPPAVRSVDYDVLASDDARRWRLLRRVRGSDGGLDALFLPESEARHLRIRRVRGGAARPQVVLRSAAEWPAFNAVLARLGADAPRGDLPRAFVGEQNHWTLVGVDGGGERSGLMSEDGALEVGRGGFSVEPSVWLDDGQRVTWAEAAPTQTLRDDSLPLPRVRWQHAAFTLDIEAAADGPRDAPNLLARYVLRNTGSRAQTVTLMLAVRPWQVNPPQQFLSTPGGERELHTLRWQGGVLSVNDGSSLQTTSAPQRVSALPFDGGASLRALRAAPELTLVRDPQQHASAALQFRIELPAGASRSIGWVAPLGARVPDPNAVTAAELDRRFDAAASRWHERLNRVRLQVPPDGQPLVDTLRTSLAHILMSRDGPALRPGTRSYARTWVRDGAMMLAGLVRLGEIDAAREFVDWYAGHIFDSGKVPCCVDQRGADPVVENDSHGQYLYAVAELWRHTGDADLLSRHWPQVQRVTAWMEALRQSERGEANRRPERAHLFGLMPPSISHEGYSDKPAYSYWDDFWALRGFKDAVLIAQALGHATQAQQWSAWRDEFQRELAASIAATAAHHRSGVIAGAADRGDFDPTSTTMALNPAQAQDALPPHLLAATFDRYWREAVERSEGRRAWKDYTPYELRSVGAFVRLGQAERAHAMLDFFFRHQRPRGWNQWAEVVLPDEREPRFLGDMPHAWVSSDYIRSVLDVFAYEREADAAIVIGAGFKPPWLAQGVEVSGLSTPHGRLDYRLDPTPEGWTLSVPRALAGLRGGLRLAWPGSGPLPRATHEGRELAWQGRELPIMSTPAIVTLRRQP